MLKAIVNFGLYGLIVLVLIAMIFENLVTKTRNKLVDEIITIRRKYRFNKLDKYYNEIGGEDNESTS